jgi:hypothetical protein
MPTLDSLFDQFLRERRSLKNVSPETLVWYETAWKSFLATAVGGACEFRPLKLEMRFVKTLDEKALRATQPARSN